MTGRPALLLMLAAAGPAWAGSVTVRNGTADTVREIRMGPPGGQVGENRMRSQLPPGAEARIGYSTSCKADLRLVFAGGRTEDHPGLDVCADARIVAGQEGTAGPAMAALPAASPAPPGKPAAAKVAPGPAKEPPPVVPPWTGRSITKRFGGLD